MWPVSVLDDALAHASELVALPEKHAHSIARYAAAVAREHDLRVEWEGLGRPVMTLGGATGRSEVVHPLVAAIAAAEAHSQKLAEGLGLLPGSRKGVMGRPQEQVVPAGGEPPKLRSVS